MLGFKYIKLKIIDNFSKSLLMQQTTTYNVQTIYTLVVELLGLSLLHEPPTKGSCPQ